MHPRNGSQVFHAIFSLAVLRVTEAKESESESHWSYDNQAAWPGLCQNGTRQSPIILNEYNATKATVSPLYIEHISNYFEDLEVENNGHTVELMFSSVTDAPTLSGAGLPGNFTLNNVHFHWPSEHIINGEYADLEAHFVFYSQEYANLSEALEVPHAVTVVGVLFEEVEEDIDNSFDVLDDAVEAVTYPGTTNTKGNITLADFFPDETDTFFQYTGSLTTPKCNENINWIVFNSNGIISTDDLTKLVHIYTEDHKRLVSNNRQLQKRRGRTIYLSSQSS
ncbi:carbonic anhydrase 14 isoform X2 [Dendroctonus ponderosae]|uniref:carbonic anhydrase 14 isoform X2 n=1 Tax=Dendroctonus ponderosae TaxID=77166 RepID=UPI0020350BCE|nr:carbonic anhydrase 14 isoform X2 [Dendroctonus ponderosae]